MTKILYVEDNEDNIYMLTQRLKKKGFEIVIANDGREGVSKAKTEKPDLILMDLSLPELDGWEATRLINADQETSQIPVIALTAHAMKEHMDKALIRISRLRESQHGSRSVHRSSFCAELALSQRVRTYRRTHVRIIWLSARFIRT